MCRCSKRILVSAPSSQLACPMSACSSALLLFLLLEGLLRAGGGDVQESPGCAGIQLLLIPTQRPNIHHPHHLLLLREEESTWSVLHSMEACSFKGLLLYYFQAYSIGLRYIKNMSMKCFTQNTKQITHSSHASYPSISALWSTQQLSSVKREGSTQILS